MSFMDINPWTRGHALVIPRTHSRNLLRDRGGRPRARAARAKRLAASMRERLGCDGINLLNSSEPAAWQTMFHFHIHVIPRYEDDPLRLPGRAAAGGSGRAAGGGGRTAMRAQRRCAAVFLRSACTMLTLAAAAGLAVAQGGTTPSRTATTPVACRHRAARATHDRSNDRLAHIVRFHGGISPGDVPQRGRRARPARQRVREHLDGAHAVGGVAELRRVRDRRPRREQLIASVSGSARAEASGAWGARPRSSPAGGGWSCGSTRTDPPTRRLPLVGAGDDVRARLHKPRLPGRGAPSRPHGADGTGRPDGLRTGVPPHSP